AAQKSMWKDALSRIDRWGRQATSKYNKEHEDDDGYQPVRWVCPANSVHVQGLSCIGGTQTQLRGEGYYDRYPYLPWSMADLYRGITPLCLVEEWGRLFRTPMSIARKVIHKFVDYLAAQATELIWKLRCKTTIAREKLMGINASIQGKGP
ncbi:hypothetical protein BGX28_006155, partial [Mortierella sp. GBA30]